MLRFWPCERCIGGGLWSSLEGQSSDPFTLSSGISDTDFSDYGFAWTPHGTYARDLAHFVERFGFTPHESIIAATDRKSVV